ncbi:SdiA-regulated domain-containing protein [Larkinella bovis]|uniref:SdiA-regulated domain-containing protein n=1 Tax=Larkinella bovis TaxID=683041 RepID=A0ABW0IFR3_9BACT
MNSFLLFLFSLKVTLCSCHAENKRSGFRSGRSQYAVSRVGRLAAVVNESSGLVYRPNRRTFWTHNDSGGRPTLYEVSGDGSLVDSLALPMLKNQDWEALTSQDTTVLFIGDIGNNANARRQLSIYRINLHHPNDFQPITFQYARQQTFPASKDTRNFDSEALFFANDSLFLVSKNRSKPRRLVSLYGFPAQTGNHTLEPVDSVFLKSMVTDATLSPDGRTLAVLTYGKIFLFEQKSSRISFQNPTHCLRIPRGQTEGLTFVNNTDLIMTNESGKMYFIKKRTKHSE